jgi:hypothetical protein
MTGVVDPDPDPVFVTKNDIIYFFNASYFFLDDQKRPPSSVISLQPFKKNMKLLLFEG